MMSDLSIVFEGSAGQGMQTITKMLLPILKKNCFNVFSCSELMSRIRGGSNTTEIRVTEKPRRAYVRHIDILFALTPLAYERLKDRIDSATVVFAEGEHCAIWPVGSCIVAPLKAFALEAGSPVFSNTVAVGIVLGLLDISMEMLAGYLKEQFQSKGDDTVSKNIRAATLGYEWSRNCPAYGRFKLPSRYKENPESKLMMDGTTALGIGTVAAGCNFISSYPMSPSTGLLTFLAEKAKTFGIVVDQAEDEIAAVNAGIGASFAGARAIVTTSGGGFDLMQEGFSLAGMTETPIVIHLGQRPGPATGLPTRTEQGDFNLVQHAGHGEFARAVFAPGTFEELHFLAQKAFAVAQEFQIPVVLLTDQYLLDSVTTVDSVLLETLPVKDWLVETYKSYRRYSLTDNGISPRGVPGHGTGIVRADSDEHDEEGLITEDFMVRRRMVEKRLKRLEKLKAEALMPYMIGDAGNADTLVISWGSNRGVVEEALELLGKRCIAGVHFSQVYPLNPGVSGLFGSRRLLVVENNATGQFADFIELETGRKIDRRILKATGEPFSVEDILEALQEECHGY
jgi:2-oxoglutarate/2-oxoacid ferredoxin oxidoreductase subunit alpha